LSGEPKRNALGECIRRSFNILWNLVESYHLGDVASLFGLVITVVGFGLALWRIRKLQTAAEQARQAVERVREQILHMNAIQELNGAIRKLEDMRRLHRIKAWKFCPIDTLR